MKNLFIGLNSIFHQKADNQYKF